MSQSLGKVTAQTTRAIKADAIYTVGDVTGGHMVSRRRRCGCGCGLHHDALAKLHLQEFAVLGELAQVELPDVLAELLGRNFWPVKMSQLQAFTCTAVRIHI